MGKKKKNADFQKVKFKVGKKLPKADNYTDTSFKSRSIVIREQLKSTTDAALSKGGHTFQELVRQMRHHNLNVRQTAASGLQDLITTHPDVLQQNICDILDAAMELCRDRDSAVRAAALRLVLVVLSAVGEVAARSFFTLIGAHVCCALTHINDAVRLDALQLFDAVAAAYPNFVPTRASALLEIFMNQISRVVGPASSAVVQRRTLIVDPGNLLSGRQSRGRVLQRIQLVLQALSDVGTPDRAAGDNGSAVNFTSVDAAAEYVQQRFINRTYYLHGRMAADRATSSQSLNASRRVDSHQLVVSLCSLLAEHWVEVVPSASSGHLTTIGGQPLKARDTAVLKFVPSIAALAWKLLNAETNSNAQFTASKHGMTLAKVLLAGFPYSSSSGCYGEGKKRRKVQSDESSAAVSEGRSFDVLHSSVDRDAVKKASIIVSDTAMVTSAAGWQLRQRIEQGMPVVQTMKAVRNDRLLSCHHGVQRGVHLDSTATLAELLGKYYWPTVDFDVSEFVKSCKVCQQSCPRLEKANGEDVTLLSRAVAGRADRQADEESAEVGGQRPLSFANRKRHAGQEEPVSAVDLNISICCFVSMLSKDGASFEPEWARRVVDFVAVVLSESRIPTPKTLRQLLDAIHRLQIFAEANESNGRGELSGIFGTLLRRSLGERNIDGIMTLLQFAQDITLNDLDTNKFTSEQQLAAAIAPPIVDLLKGATNWTLLSVCGTAAVRMLKSYSLRRVYILDQKDLAACLDCLAVAVGSTDCRCSQDEVARYLQELVLLIECTPVGLTDIVLTRLASLLRLLNHCNFVIKFTISAVTRRFIDADKNQIDKKDYFNFMFGLLLDGSFTDHSRHLVDVDFTDTWLRAQAVRDSLLNFNDSEAKQVGQALSAFIDRALAVRPEGLSEGTCAALLLCAQQLDDTRSLPTESVLSLVGTLLMHRPGHLWSADGDSACDEPGATIVCVLTSRPDVLSTIVRHLHAAVGRVHAESKLCVFVSALTWLLKAMPSHVLSTTGVLTAIHEELGSLDDDADDAGDVNMAAQEMLGSDVVESLRYELRRINQFLPVGDGVSNVTGATL